MRGPACVRFGAPIPMDELRASPRPGRNRRATERIMEALADMVRRVGGPAQDAPTGCPLDPAPPRQGSDPQLRARRKTMWRAQMASEKQARRWPRHRRYWW